MKNFILLGDIHKSIYFLSWKEQGSQLNLLAKDFDSLDCLATEFLIDGSMLSLTVSDEQKNVQVAPSAVHVSFKLQSLMGYIMQKMLVNDLNFLSMVPVWQELKQEFIWIFFPFFGHE